MARSEKTAELFAAIESVVLEQSLNTDHSVRTPEELIELFDSETVKLAKHDWHCSHLYSDAIKALAKRAKQLVKKRGHTFAELLEECSQIRSQGLRDEVVGDLKNSLFPIDALPTVVLGLTGSDLYFYGTGVNSLLKPMVEVMECGIVKLDFLSPAIKAASNCCRDDDVPKSLQTTLKALLAAWPADADIGWCLIANRSNGLSAPQRGFR